MKKRYWLFVFAGLLAVTAALCARHFQAKRAMGKVLPVNKKLISANTDFSIRLFKDIASRRSGRNTLISPSSVSMSLAMAYNGSKGDTRKLMGAVLGLDKMSLHEINNSNANLLVNLNNPGRGVNISAANGMWTGKVFPIVPSFIDISRKYYDAEVASLDFTHRSAKSAIDGWVRKKTHGRIDNIAEDLGGLTVLCLANAIYFKGTWTFRFDKNETQAEPFMLEDGKIKSVPMMSQEGRFRYCMGQNFEAAALPYGSKRMSMYIFVPCEGCSLSEFLKTLNAKNWNKWLPSFQEQKVRVTLPRWKLECETNLIPPCTDLGMGNIFDSGKCDFSGICKSDRNDVYISSLKQKAFIEVNEEGTEAAAATFMVLKARCATPEVRANRPFFYAIRDDMTGTILFMGTVVDPAMDAGIL
ncbi:MAG: serpin family protein [Armatimonadota bacterium]